MTTVQTSPDTVHATAARVRSSDGTDLYLRRYGGDAARPVLFLHGLGADGLVWAATASRLDSGFQALTLDLRGHGRSGAPLDQSYSSQDQWADDLHAVLETVRSPAVVVAWSYAAMVVADYVRKFGTGALGAIYLVAPLRKVGTSGAPDLLHPDFLRQVPGLLSNELPASVAATKAFLGLVTAEPLGEKEQLERLGSALGVPAEVRMAMLSREQDNDDVWAGLELPLGLAYGGADRITTPASSVELAELVAFTQTDVHVDAGHAVFLDDEQAFADNLNRFIAGH